MVEKRIIRVSEDMIKELERIRDKYKKDGIYMDNPSASRLVIRELQNLREKNQKNVNPWDMGLSKK